MYSGNYNPTVAGSYYPQIQPSYIPPTYQPIVRQNNSMVNGRLINNESEITPSEIPMDNSVSLFPLNDYSVIIAKQWGKDGTIQTVRYVPEQSNGEPQESLSDLVNRRFDELAKLVKRNNSGQRYQKKESERDASN